MSTRTITADIQAWLPGHCDGRALDDGVEPIRALNELAYSSHDMSDQGWVRVGVATISVQIPSGKELKVAKIEALRAEIQHTRAEAEDKCQRLEQTISNLLAIEYEQPAEEWAL